MTHHANRAVLWLNSNSLGPAIVPSDRAVATFYKLSIVTIRRSAAIWTQF